MSDETPTPELVKRTGDFPVVAAADRPTVLVLDDDWEICGALDDVLTDAGFNVVSLANGALGLAHLVGHPKPAAIILDLMMPTMNGWTFADRLQAIPDFRDIPIIVMTAVGPHWGYPAARVIRKPVNRLELITTLREVVYGRAGASARGL